MEINLQNVEEIIFYDKKLHSLLFDLKHFFDEWYLFKQSGISQNKKMFFNFLLALNENHLIILREYFDQEIFVKKFESNSVKEIVISSSDFDDGFCDCFSYKEFCITKNKNNVKITLWR